MDNKWQILADFENKLQDENIALKQRYHVLSSMYADLQVENKKLKRIIEKYRNKEVFIFGEEDNVL